MLTGGARRATVRIPNAVCYIAQKLLIHDDRKPEDRGKDVLYIHDTIELFGDSIGELRYLWLNTVQPLMRRTAAKIEKKAKQMFENVTDPVRNAALQAAGRGLTPDDIRTLCDWGIGAIFGDDGSRG